MHLWRTKEGVIASDGVHAVTIPNEWDALINRQDLLEYLASRLPDPASEPSSLAQLRERKARRGASADRHARRCGRRG